MSKLLTERSKDFERQRKEMMLYMEKESNLHQNSMDQIENVVEKVGTTLDQFYVQSNHSPLQRPEC